MSVSESPITHEQESSNKMICTVCRTLYLLSAAAAFLEPLILLMINIEIS